MYIDLCYVYHQDPEVVHSPLPVFHRPPSIERDTTVMRPQDPDRMVLTVEPPRRYLEPDSPNSMDQLIGPQSPDFDNAPLQKKPNLSTSAESIDKLLKEDNTKTQPPTNIAKCKLFSYKPVFDYEATGELKKNALKNVMGATAEPPTLEVSAVMHTNETQSAQPRGGDNIASLSMNTPTETNHLDSGLQNNLSQGVGSVPPGGVAAVSPSGNSSTNTDTCSSMPANTQNTSNLPASIARSRPSPKRPITESMTLLSLERGCSHKALHTPAGSDSTSTCLPQAESQASCKKTQNKDSSAGNPWKPRTDLSPTRKCALGQGQVSLGKDGNSAAPVTYKNVPVNMTVGGTASTNRIERHDTLSGNQSPEPTSQDSMLQGSTPEDATNSSNDGGDSGVVIDIKNGSMLKDKCDSCKWL